MFLDALGERIELLIAELAPGLKGVRIDQRNIDLQRANPWMGERLSVGVSQGHGFDDGRVFAGIGWMACGSIGSRSDDFFEWGAQEGSQSASESSVFSHDRVPPCKVLCTLWHHGTSGHSSIRSARGLGIR